MHFPAAALLSPERPKFLLDAAGHSRPKKTSRARVCFLAFGSLGKPAQIYFAVSGNASRVFHPFAGGQVLGGEKNQAFVLPTHGS